MTVALNLEEIKKDPQRITKIKPFINKCNKERINFPSEKDDWKQLVINNVKIALNVLYAKKIVIYHAYVSKHNSNREKQVIILIISNGEKWHYLAVKKLLALFRGIKGKHQGDFYCLNCLHCFAIENNCESHKTVCENKDFCNIIMLPKDTKVLELNKYQKSDKAPFIIYTDLEYITEKIDGC